MRGRYSSAAIRRGTVTIRPDPTRFAHVIRISFEVTVNEHRRFSA
jgi:hypothetical protein